VKNIVEELSGCIRGIYKDIFETLHIFDELKNNNAIAYIDPPYKNTTSYGSYFNVGELILAIWNNIPIYVSEGSQIEGAKKYYLLSEGRAKGNISGKVSKKPTEEWLNKF
jgi:hypothetical protein